MSQFLKPSYLKSATPILHTFVEGKLELASVAFEGAIEDVYENVVFEETID